jgi:hypothetical protein
MAIQFLSDIDLKGAVDLDGPLLLEGSAGTTGQVLKSQGPGNPPEWGDGGSAVDSVIAGMIF